MILKQKHISFINFIKVSKGILFFSAFLIANSLSAQVVSISSMDSNAAEVISGAQNLASFTISRPVGASFPTEIEYDVTGSATLGVDYSLVSGSVTLTSTQNSVTIPITTIDDDSLVEGEETIIVTLTTVTSPSTISPSARQVTINIADNDTSNITLTASDPIATENTPNNDPGFFTIDLGAVNNSPSDIIVSYSVNASSTATEPDDFQISRNAFILQGDQTVNVGFQAIDDDLVEGDESVSITLDSSSLESSFIVTPATTATVIINDNDVGVVSLEMAANFIATVNEDGTLQMPAEFGQFRPVIDKANGTSTNLRVDYQITGTADINTDYNLTNAVALIFANNETSRARNIRVAPIEDSDSESDETVVITLISTDNPLYTIGSPATATITIIDNEVCVAGTTAPMLNTATATERCDVTSVNLNTFITGGAASAPPNTALRWSEVENPTTGSDLIPATVSVSGTYYGVYWDAGNTCASPSTQVDLLLSTSPSAGANANGAACNNATSTFGATSLDLDTLLAAGIDPGAWVFTSGPETAIPNANNLVQFSGRLSGSYVYTYTTTNAVLPCVNDSAVFTITVDDCDPCVAGTTAPVLSSSAPDTEYCRDVDNNETLTLDLDDFTNTPIPAGTELRWTTISDLENENAHLTNNVITISTGATYRGFFWDDVNNCASPALEISILIQPIPVLTVGENQERCGSGTITFTATASLNATINWYASATGGSILSSGSSFTIPNVIVSTSFYAEATLNDCVSERQEVIATIQQQPSAGIAQNNGNASACSIEENGPTILDLDDLISGEDAGDWVYNSGPLANFNIPTNNILNFEGRPDGEYVFTFTTTEGQAPCVNESTAITITVNDCDIDTDLDGLFDGPEATLGTDPTNPDTDGDGVNDGEEVGSDIENPLDTDEDGIIDALDSNILDSDMDGVVDQIDPANDNPCIPDNTNGLCDTDEDGITDGQEIANGTDPLDPCDPNLDSPTCINPVPIDLEITKDVDNINAFFEEEVTFTITLRNLSNSIVRAIKIGEILENGFEYISDEASVGNYDAQTGDWDIFEIEALSIHTLSINVKIIEGGTYSNTAELLDSFPTDDNAVNDSATITLPIELPEGIDLVLEKTAISSNPLINEEVIFTLKVTNDSDDENPVNNIEVRDILDSNNFQYIDDTTNDGAYDVDSGIWSIPSIPKGEEAILEIRVRVPNEGEFTNTATIIRSVPADGNPDNNEATVEITVSLPTPADVGFLFNQFSPNADGTNDVLKINRLNSETNQEVEIRYNIQIFNRYGSLVFEDNGKSESEVWDGSWEGKDAPSGTYFYTMNIDIGDGQGPQLKKGWIQLIR